MKNRLEGERARMTALGITLLTISFVDKEDVSF